MKIYNSIGNEIIDVVVNDESYRYRKIKDDDELTLYFSLAEHVEIPIGSYCIYEGQSYWLHKPEHVNVIHRRAFEYTIVFKAYELSKYRFRELTYNGSFGGSRKLKFPMTATASEFLQMVVDNLNFREGVGTWSVGTCIESTEKALSFNHVSILDALNQISDEYETEWEINNNVISLHKLEYNKDNPLALSYGKGNGFKSGISRVNEDKMPVELLYTQGGDKNINATDYGSQELLLPKLQTLQFDGEHFEDEDGFDASNARTYITDADGYFICRSDIQLPSKRNEDSLDCSEIYPKRVGTVEQVWTTLDSGNNVMYHFYDNTIPQSLNYEDCLIEGETMTVIFQTGMLAGKEFEVNYTHGQDKEFVIKSQEIDGMTMPGDVYIPRYGDEYAVFNVMMPNSYICDNATKSGASWDMFREAVKYLYDNEEQKITFTGELDGIWASQDWLNIGGKIKLGGYVSFTDAAIQATPVKIRIVGIKDYVNKPHNPEIELSNSTIRGGVMSSINEIGNNEVVVNELHQQALQFTKRRWRDARETITMLENALLGHFTNSINPIAVQTMSLLVGDESLQFRFVDDLNQPSQQVTHNVTYNQQTKVLNSPAGIIQHMTINVRQIQCAHLYNSMDWLTWSLPTYSSPILTDAAQGYYLYAKVSKIEQSGEFLLSENAISMESVSGYYHLLMGVLNSEYDGERSYVSLYGFTEILPGRITTDMIVSANGQCYFDLINNIISGKVRFLAGSSGYNNITDAPDLSVFLKDTDGLIEITPNGYETPTLNNEPAINWLNDAQKEIHIGDLYFKFNDAAIPPEPVRSWWRFEKRSTIQRDEIESPYSYGWYQVYPIPAWFENIKNAHKLFTYVVPFPPYNVNDVWLNGGVFLKCNTSKSSIEEFNHGDWDDAGVYDNTVTTINGGMVTSGTIQLAGDDSCIKAGITGDGTTDDSVRIWAGDEYNHRDIAPFQVRQDGKLLATNASIMGAVEATSGRFWGSIATPPKPIANTAADFNLDFSTGFNFAGGLDVAEQKIIILPRLLDYAGVECTIINYGVTVGKAGYYRIKPFGDGSTFLYSGNNNFLNTIYYVDLYPTAELKLKAINVRGTLRWYIENYMSFSYDAVNHLLTNNLPNPYLRCVYSGRVATVNSLAVNSCSDNNILQIGHVTTGEFNFTFEKSRRSNNYAVVINGISDCFVADVLLKSASGFTIKLGARWFFGDQTGITYFDATGWSLMIFEFD